MDSVTHVEEVRFVLFGGEMLKIFLAAMKEEAASRGWRLDNQGLWNPPEA